METLTETNEQAHSIQLDLYEHFFESVTLIDYPEMTRRFSSFEAVLFQHMTYEDEEVLEVFKTSCPDGLAELTQVEGDHRILLRCIDNVKSASKRIVESEDPRRTLVRNLGAFNRLKEVLEHHTLRESTHIYPRLDGALTTVQRECLNRGLIQCTLSGLV